MANAELLEGLIRFTGREPWAECFEDVFDEHFGEFFDAANTDFDGLCALVGEEWSEALWSCAFEDFLTQEFEAPGANAADDYLKRRGWKESVAAKTLIGALRGSAPSLWRVESVEPGASFVARDLLRGGEAVAVVDGKAAAGLSVGDRFVARIMRVRDSWAIGAGLLPFSEEDSQGLFVAVEAAAEETGGGKPPAADSETLAALAPLFTRIWLALRLIATQDQPAPVNDDGEPLLFHEVRFLLASASPEVVAKRLAAIPGLTREEVDLWICARPGEGADEEADGEGQGLDVVLEDGRLILWEAALEGGALAARANSAARAALARVALEAALGDLADAPETESWTLADIGRSALEFDGAPEDEDEG